MNPTVFDFRDYPIIDDREFFVSAWCWHPSFIPAEVASSSSNLMFWACYRRSFGLVAPTYRACATPSALVSWHTRTRGLCLARLAEGTATTMTVVMTIVATVTTAPMGVR